MPYYDAKRPYVNYWFASSEGPSVEPFNQTISEANQEKLEQEGGACIMYTHFGTDFYKNGKLNPRFMDLMTKLSQRNGWFVPVSTLLDYILDKRWHITLSAKQRRELEWRWLRDKMRVGGTS